MGLSIAQCFTIAKFITLFIPMQFVMPHNTMIALNIIEAIVTDLCMNRIECYCNAFFGSALIILLYKQVKSPLGFYIAVYLVHGMEHDIHLHKRLHCVFSHCE